MNKKTVLFSIATIATKQIFAQTNTDFISNHSNIIILLTLVIAIAALILAIVNTFKVAYNKKIREVNLVNQKDDLNVSMDAIKITLSKDIRGIKRDLSKIERHSKTKNQQATPNKVIPEDSKEKQTTETQAIEKKPKKRPFNKRRPFHKKPMTNKDDQKKD